MKVLTTAIPLLALLAGCDPIWHHRVSVLRAPCDFRGDAPPNRAPLPKATIRVDCSAAGHPFSATLTSDGSGEAEYGGIGYGIPQACTVEVTKDGYGRRRYHVGEFCSDPAFPGEPNPKAKCRFGALRAELVSRGEEAPSPPAAAP